MKCTNTVISICIFLYITTNSVVSSFSILDNTNKGYTIRSKENKGVSIEYLKTVFAEEVENYSEHNTLHTTIYELEDTSIEENGFIRSKGEDIICPHDGKVGAAFVDCLHGEDNVGVANVMLSYCWDNTVDEIIDVLDHFALKKDLDPKKTYVWICCLCNNQHRVFERSKKGEVVSFEEFQATVEDQVKSVDSVVALMSSWQNSLYLTRMRCIYELYTAHENGCDINIEMPRKGRKDFYWTIHNDPSAFHNVIADFGSNKIENAEVTMEEERENILRIVEAGGGTDSLNAVVNGCIQEWIFQTLQDYVEADLHDLGKYPLDLDRGYNNVGSILYYNEQFEAAMIWYDDHCLMCDICFGENSVYTAKVYSNIAMVHSSLEEYDEAIEFNENSISIKEKAYGLNHIDTGISYYNIGTVYLDKEDCETALWYLNKSCDIYENTHGKEHEETVKVYNNIGLAHMGNGDYETAMQYFENSLEISKKIFGEDHPSTATRYSNVGHVHGEKGDIEKELEYYFMALDIFEKVLGVNHSKTITTYENISDAYERKGDNEQEVIKYSKKANQEQ